MQVDGRVASVLILVALVAGSGIGYLANANSTHTDTYTAVTTYTYRTTETIVTTYTATSPEGSGLLRCVVTEYTVWMVAYVSSGGTSYSYSTTTEQSPISTYTSTTTATQTVGFTTVTTSAYTGTITGALAKGNFTTCTYISS